MSNANAVAAVATRRPDISGQLVFDAHVAANAAGETIDGLVKRITDATGIVLHNEEEKKSFIAVLNVRRSNMKKKLEGEFQAERSDMEKALTDTINVHGDASQEANDIRAKIRELNKTEKTTLSVLELNRRGRTGDQPGMSLRAMLTNSILKHHAKPVDASPADATPADNVNDIDVE